jgi:hypothetical protein
MYYCWEFLLLHGNHLLHHQGIKCQSNIYNLIGRILEEAMMRNYENSKQLPGASKTWVFLQEIDIKETIRNKEIDQN